MWRQSPPHRPLHPLPRIAGPVHEDRLTRTHFVRLIAIAVMGATLMQLGYVAALGGHIVPPGAIAARPLAGVMTSTLRAEAEERRAAVPAAPRPSPHDVRAIYLTSWAAATPALVREALALAQTTEINGVVIDIKDYSGVVAFTTHNPLIEALGSDRSRIDLAALTEQFHRQGIYVIVRIAAFQDQHLLTVKPSLAVRDATGQIWRDRRGLGWVDPGSPEVWTYLVEISRAAVRAGVDELNYDYVRFPTDGRLEDMRFPVTDATHQSRRQVLRRFYEYLTTALRPTRVHLSADLFGYATVRPDDLGIGQILEDAFLYFDYISPMVYPSHYASGFLQFGNPAEHPYEVVHYSLQYAEKRRHRFARLLGTLPEGVDGTSPIDHVAKLRPWLQAFDMGAAYPPSVIRKQMDATYDAGLTSGWYLWNPASRYHAATFLPARREQTSPR
ncbi:MAG TPA: putative glycoside hydrolase [bacterium]